SRLPDLLAQPRQHRERSDRLPGVRGERSTVVGAVAQRRHADLRARIPRATRLLMAFRVFVCACLLVGAIPAAGAVDDYIGKPVAAVRLLIEGRESTDAALRQVVDTAVGRPLSMAQVRESVVHLFSLERFEDVRVDAALENG